jgi:thiol-disulfide isomerase/thioredoxin
MVRAAITLLVLTISLTNTGNAQCEPSALVRKILERASRAQDAKLLEADSYPERVSILETGLAKHRNDYFLLKARMLTEPKQDGQIRWAVERRKEHTGQAVYTLLYAMSLVKRNTPEALTLLGRLTASEPEAAQAYLQLANSHSWGNFKDLAKTQAEMEGFLKRCPATLDSDALGTVSRTSTKEQMARTAVALRKRLPNENDLLLLELWETLWNLEFKTRPVAEHAQVRAQIVRDLARLERSPKRREVESLMVLFQGYVLLSNSAEREKTADEILQNYPLSNAARQIIVGRWGKQYTLPNDSKKAERLTFYRSSLAAAEEWHQRWPNDFYLLYKKLEALTALPDTTGEQVANTADQLLAVNAKYPDSYYTPYIYIKTAAAYIKAKIRLDQVPELVENGYRLIVEREESRSKDDRVTADGLEPWKDRAAYFAQWRADVLLDYFEISKQPDRALKIDQEMQALDTPSYRKAYQLRLHAQAFAIAGRKLDALFLYRDVLAAETDPASDDDEDSPAHSMERLWKELGGTSETYSAFLGGAKSAPAAAVVWERPTHPVPAFSIPDTQGKPWKLADWSGKTLVISVWATWCTPCREELPQVEKFYQETKDRKDVALITFNVDEDITKVAPYIQDNKYTFPVFLARELVDSVSEKGYPQTWIVNSKGTLEWTLTSTDPKWRDTVKAKLEEMQKQAN